MKRKLLLSVICFVVVALQVNAQPLMRRSIGVSWNYFGFNSTHSNNSEKQTFGTIGVNYGYCFNKWIEVNGSIGWSHSWFGPDANPAYAYPKKDNSILLLAGCDVNWFQKGLIQLYSGVAGGVDVRVQKNDRGSYTTMELAGQFDAVGMELDLGRAYIDMSLGWGSMGCVRLGAGIKF